MVSQQTRDFWVRFSWIWTVIYYLTVIIPVSLVIREGHESLALILTLAAAAVLWYTGGLWLAKVRFHGRLSTPLALIFIGGLLLLWFVLVKLDEAFYFMLFSLFSQIYALLPVRPAVFMSLVLAGLMFLSQEPGATFYPAWDNANFWSFLLSILFGTVFALWINGIIRQSSERRELIQQLQDAQTELAAAERRQGVLTERQRLAREIHDTLAQGFTSIVMHLEAAEQALPDDPPTLQRHLNQARQTARDSLTQARRVVQDLRPELLEKEPLNEALARTVRRWSEESGIPAAINTSGAACSLHPQIEVTLLRAVQEALANVRKHAGAASVAVTLTYFDDLVVLDVQDDGGGIQADAAPGPLSGGFGLQAMRERVEGLNGRLLVESERGEGTTVVVEIPLVNEPDID